MKQTQKTLNFPPDFFTSEPKRPRKRRLAPLGSTSRQRLPIIRVSEIERHSPNPSYSSVPDEEVELNSLIHPINELYTSTQTVERSVSGRSSYIRQHLSPSFSAAISPVLLSPIVSPRSTEGRSHLPHLKPLMHSTSARSMKGNFHFSKESPRLPTLETPMKSMNVTFSIPKRRESSYPSKPYSM
jgi:hypothetical protein